MVHCFTYTHKGNPLYFVWDVESGSLHNVDEAAFLVSKKDISSFRTTRTSVI